VASVAKALGDYDGANEYVAYCTDDSLDIVPHTANFIRRRVGIKGTSRIQRIAYEQTALQFLAKRDQVGCLHWFANTVAFVNAVPGLATFHDFLVFENPRQFCFPKRIYLRAMIRHGARHAAISLAISKKTAADLVARFKVDKDRVVVVPTPIGLEFAPCEGERVEQFRHAYSLPGEFWLYVAHCYPHKNHERLFQAYARLKARKPDTWPLVLRGERCERGELLDRQIEEAGIRQHVFWLPRLKSGEMPLLYNAATSLIFPSLYEGLGIPVLEAMACGLPVVASDIPTNREFGDGALLFFDATDADAIADAMEKAMSDNILREHGRRQGLTRAAELRPDKIAARLVEAYGRACAAGTGQKPQGGKR
jgi:alpha-1,3-rhamnosyl/mannosyltransferase